MLQTIFGGKGFILFVLSVLFFHAFAAHAQEKKNLRIVFVSLSWNNQLPFRVAIAKGFFKDQGLTLEPIFVRGGPIAITALISGNVDFASTGGDPQQRPRPRSADHRLAV